MSLGITNNVVNRRLLQSGYITSNYTGTLAIAGYDTGKVIQAAENYLEGNEAFGNGVDKDLLAGNAYVNSRTTGATLYQGSGEHEGTYTNINFWKGGATFQDEFTTANQIANNAVTFSDGLNGTSGYVKNYSKLKLSAGAAKLYVYQDVGRNVLGSPYSESIDTESDIWSNTTLNFVNINTGNWNGAKYSQGVIGGSESEKASYNALISLIDSFDETDKEVLSQYTKGTAKWFETAIQIAKNSGDVFNPS